MDLEWRCKHFGVHTGCYFCIAVHFIFALGGVVVGLFLQDPHYSGDEPVPNRGDEQHAVLLLQARYGGGHTMVCGFCRAGYYSKSGQEGHCKRFAGLALHWFRLRYHRNQYGVRAAAGADWRVLPVQFPVGPLPGHAQL